MSDLEDTGVSVAVVIELIASFLTTIESKGVEPPLKAISQFRHPLQLTRVELQYEASDYRTTQSNESMQ